MILVREDVAKCYSIEDLYLQLAYNILKISDGELHLSRENWENIVACIDEIRGVCKLEDVLFDMIVPIKEVAEKYGKTKCEYIKYYSSESHCMNIRLRLVLIDNILNKTIEDMKFS